MHRLRTLCVLLVVALVAAAAAQAEIVVSRDNSGRSITFDVRSAAADVEWYAGLLRSAAHGDEIRRVTFTAVVGRERRVGQRARIEIVCNGARVGRRALTRGRRSATLDLRRFGPARCDARLVSTTGARLDYTLRLRLAIEA
jgi:hypothetical protein